MTETELEIPVFSLNVIDIARSLQQQHGLKSYDYQRYRQYCTRRLRRIHKTLRLLAGTQKKYKGLTILPEDVTDVRVLELLLLNTERAWAYAEQLRYDYSTTDSAKQHRHYVSRMKKACDHAKVMQDIAKVVCNERTNSEVSAYVEEMNGHKALSLKNWSQAKDSYVAARDVYIKLQEGCKASVKASLVQRVTDLDQSLRFCTYNLGEDSVGGAEGASGVRQYGTVLKWRGVSITVTSEKVRNLLTTSDVSVREAQTLAKQLEAEISGNTFNKCLDMYDRAFIAFNDALQQVKQDIAQEKEGDPAMLHLLVNCLKYKLLEHTRDRNQVMIRVYTARLEQQEQSQKKKEGQKQTSALDLARLHETINQTLESMLAIPGVEDDDELAHPLTTDQFLHTAKKHFYQAETFKSMGEWSYAMPLYQAAVESIGEALAFCKTNKLDETKVLADAEGIRAARCICKAAAAIKATETEEPAQTSTRLDRDFESYKACEEITGIPPDYVSIPCRPIFLDMAQGALPKPNFSHRASADKQGQKPSVKTGGTKPKPQAKSGGDDDKQGWFGGWGWGAGAKQ